MINLLASNSDNLSLGFGIVFFALLLCAIVVCIFEIVLLLRQKKLSANKKSVEPVVIRSDDLTLRIRGGEVEAYDSVAPSEEASAVETPAEAETEERQEAVSEPVTEMAEDATYETVVLPKVEKRTFSEKYEGLGAEQKQLLDAFTAHIEGKDDCSKLVQISSLTFKYKKSQIAKAIVRRDTVVLNFAILNPDFGRMMKEEKTSGLKVKPVEIRLTSLSALEVAKQTADLTVDYLKQEEEYRLEKRREARREAMRRRRVESAASEDTQN